MSADGRSAKPARRLSQMSSVPWPTCRRTGLRSASAHPVLLPRSARGHSGPVGRIHPNRSVDRRTPVCRTSSVSRAAVLRLSKADAAHLLGYLIASRVWRRVHPRGRAGRRGAEPRAARLQKAAGCRQTSPPWTSETKVAERALRASPELRREATKPLVDRWSSCDAGNGQIRAVAPTRPRTRNTSGRRAVRGRIRGSDR